MGMTRACAIDSDTVRPEQAAADTECFLPDRHPIMTLRVFSRHQSLIVLGGIVGGVFTPTEAGAVAAVYALLVSTCVAARLDRCTDRGCDADRIGSLTDRLDSCARACA